MNKYLKEFLKRGLMFGGFGPIVLGIIYFLVSLGNEVVLSGSEVLIAIVSIYLLAFIQAGSTVFTLIENWSIFKSLSIHMGTLYLAYLSCYLVNIWIPFNWIVVLVFTAIFVLLFLIIWFTVYFIVKTTTKELNAKLK